MKKVKIILSALTVFAVVGGALAFKAQSTYSGNYKCTDSGSTLNCTIETYTITAANKPGEDIYCTTLGGNTQQCELLHVTQNP